MGKRIKQAGFKLLLDLHYSDTWADPGHQTKPTAWKDLPFDALLRQAEIYSRDTVAAMRAGGAMPDMVQVGNETTNGMLWPDGHVEDPGGWTRYGQLTQAAVRGIHAGSAPLPPPRIMIHISNGAQPGLPQWFFHNLVAAAPDVPFDVIGLSYYPDGTDTLADLQSNLAFLARTYHKPILVVETGFPHDDTPHPDQAIYNHYGLTPDGQARYLRDLTVAVRATPGGLGRGVLYWEPEWIGIDGLPQFYGSNPLFDSRFNALPGLAALTAIPPPFVPKPSQTGVTHYTRRL